MDLSDWIERWAADKFTIVDLYFEAKQVWVPISEGEIITDFRLTNHSKLL